jgi:acid phosphatase (class A)
MKGALQMKNAAVIYKHRRWFWVFVCVTVMAGCAGFEQQRPSAAESAVQAGFLPGYLQTEELPGSLALLPPPPPDGSLAQALDTAVNRKSLALRSTPRWALAAEDADLMFPEAADSFACAVGIPVTEQDTPRLCRLLHRVLTDAGHSTSGAKRYYQRKRPFMVNNEPTCTPEWEAPMRKNGAYPSGHTALGWAWALILSELAPDRADAILARGRAYGESRIVCNVHWHSDVVEGRFMGAAVVARLHADPDFRADLEAAGAEVAQSRARGLEPPKNCHAETVALAYHWQNLTGEADILRSWQGDYPTAGLDRLPADQRQQAVGYIDDAGFFEKVWKAFKPGETLPGVDFETHLVLFARNIQFYNRIAIAKVTAEFGIAEVLVVETRSAIPIADEVGLSLAVVPRRGISALQSRDGIIPIPRRR